LFPDLTGLIPLAISIVKNGTLPVINIPATLTPVISSATSNTTLDVTSVAGLVGIATAIYAGVKDHMGNKLQDNRSEAIVANQEKTINSLKASDMGAASDAMGVSALVSKLCENPDLAKLLNTTAPDLGGKTVTQYLKDQAEAWAQSNKEYYSNSMPVPGDTAKDPVIRKVAEISKQTTPTVQ
jgi:hypothetical protein